MKRFHVFRYRQGAKDCINCGWYAQISSHNKLTAAIPAAQATADVYGYAYIVDLVNEKIVWNSQHGSLTKVIKEA